MINRKIRFLFSCNCKQCKRPPARPQCFQDLVLAVVLSHDFARYSVKLKEFAHLVSVPGRDQHLIISLSQFLDNGPEKWNMRRIIQIHPDLFASGNVSRQVFYACRLKINYVSFRRHLLLLSAFRLSNEIQWRWIESICSNPITRYVARLRLDRVSTDPLNCCSPCA